MSILDIDNSINASEKIAFPVSPDFNLITIEEIVVFPTLTAEEDKITALIINIEWI
jgi:hypothetical protein